MDNDQVRLGSDAVYAKATTHWTDWFRTAFGLREDYQRGTDVGTNYGTDSKALFEPKANLIFEASPTSEYYISAGRGFHSDDIRGVNQARNTGVPGAPLIASQTGEEIGTRQEFYDRKIALTFAVFNLDAQSETTYNPDVGQDTAGPASRRIGYEINITYQAMRWLEFYGSLSQDRARFKTSYDDGTGHLGEYLPNAPFATGSFNVYVKNPGPWSGGLEYRYLGAFPLSSRRRDGFPRLEDVRPGTDRARRGLWARLWRMEWRCALLVSGWLERGPRYLQPAEQESGCHGVLVCRSSAR
jgi:outer membrane receptor protein involved in Fe transport